MTQQPFVAQGLLMVEASRLHLDTQHSVGAFRTSGHFIAETFTWQHTSVTRYRHPCPPAGLKPETPPNERPQNHASGPAANGIGDNYLHGLYYRLHLTLKSLN